MYAFSWPSAEMTDGEWHTQISPRKKIVWCSQGALKVMFLNQNSVVLDYPVQICTTVNGQYYCTLLESELNNWNCLSMMSFCSRTVQCLITIMICKIWCNKEAGKCWHILLTLQIATCDYWLFAHVKEHLWGKWFESEDNINTAVTACLHHLSKDKYRTALDHLP
jgi:hypothetical protein